MGIISNKNSLPKKEKHIIILMCYMVAVVKVHISKFGIRKLLFLGDSNISESHGEKF